MSPRPLASGQRIWIGAGGTPESAVRAGTAGLPLNLANIGGESARFKPFIDLYRRSGPTAGHPTDALRVGISSHLHVQTDAQAERDDFYSHYVRYFGDNLPGAGRKVSREDYERLPSPKGPLFVGSPQQIVDKILYQHELFRHDRFMAQIDIGGLPHAKVANAIELLATDVLPAVRKALTHIDVPGGVNAP